MSYSWNDSSPKCGLCANIIGMYSKKIYKFFDDCINGVKINEVMSNMFPYGYYSRADMNSELICECCYTQAVEMSRRDVKWVDCFKEMDEIKNKFSHLRGRDDFDYFLSPTNPSTSAAPSTIVSGSTYNEDNAASSTIVSRSTYNVDHSGNRPTSAAPSTIVSGSTYNEYNAASSTIVSRSTYNVDHSGNRPTSAAPSTIVSGSTYYNEDNSGNCPTFSSPFTTFTGNQYRQTFPASSTVIVSRSTYNVDHSGNRPTSAAPSTIVSGSTYYNEDNSGNCPTFSSPFTTFTGNQYRQTFPASSTVIVSRSTYYEDNSGNRPTSAASSIIVSGSTYNEDHSESSITVNGNENKEEYTNMMNCTYNTCINIMSNRVYSKSGVFYSCIIPSCKLFFKTFHKFKIHYRHHLNVNGMVCWTCIKIIPNRSKMRKHKNKDSCKFPGMFVCVFCKESFNDLQSISHHKYIKHIKN